MIERSLERFDLYPKKLLGDSGYGSAECSASWSTSRGSSHTLKYSTSRATQTGPSCAMILLGATMLYVRAPRSCA